MINDTMVVKKGLTGEYVTVIVDDEENKAVLLVGLDDTLQPVYLTLKEITLKAMLKLLEEKDAKA